MFELPFKKKIKHFSKGMKLKCSLLFALSHEPELIVMNEPTSGLDLIFRRELLDLLQALMVRANQTIFLSTHITTDLDRTAEYIIFIYICNSVFQNRMEETRDQFHIVSGHSEMIDADTERLFKGMRKTGLGFTALFEGDPSIFDAFEDELIIEKATLEDVMFFMTREVS